MMENNIVKSKTTNGWNLIADRFNTHRSETDIHPDAAVNIYVGWPTLLEQINKHKRFLGKTRCEILDFGCGAGSFLGELHKHGHKVKGVDAAEQMIENARKNLPKEIEIMHASNFYENLDNETHTKKFDIITAIHSLEWIEDIKSVIQNITRSLKDDGLVLFAVFPKSHVVDSIKIKDLFEEFDSAEDPTNGICNFDGVKIPVYIRDAHFFDQLFGAMGYEKVTEEYPPYPSAFFKKFKWEASKYPEMMILAYRKVNHCPLPL